MNLIRNLLDFGTMKKKTTAAGIIGLILTLAMPLYAEPDRSGDMFGKGGWNITDRPAVPSDRARGADMFKAVPSTLDPNADVFGRMRPNYDFGREEMVIVRPEPVPYYPLFHREGDRD